MTNASSAIATASASPNSLMVVLDWNTNDMKTQNMIAAAATTTRPGATKANSDGEFVVLVMFPLFLHATHDEDLVVHRGRKNRKQHDGQERRDQGLRRSRNTDERLPHWKTNTEIPSRPVTEQRRQHGSQRHQERPEQHHEHEEAQTHNNEQERWRVSRAGRC